MSDPGVANRRSRAGKPAKIVIFGAIVAPVETWHRSCDDQLESAAAPAAGALVGRAPSGAARDGAMKAFNTVISCASLGVAAVFGTPSTACARDTSVAGASLTGSALAGAARLASTQATRGIAKADPLPPRLRPSPSDVSGVVAAANSGAAEAAAAAAADASANLLDETPEDVAARTQAKSDGACAEDCQLKPATDITLLPQTILRNLGDMPIVGDVLITPVTTGYTIVPAEGMPAVTFTVKPTKITRGSGLVAVARF
jgi:hypothetical protein